MDTLERKAAVKCFCLLFFAPNFEKILGAYWFVTYLLADAIAKEPFDTQRCYLIL